MALEFGELPGSSTGSSTGSWSSLDNEARFFARQFFSKLRTKLSGEEAILQTARRFCRIFLSEFEKFLKEEKNSISLMASVESESEFESTNGVDGLSLERQDSDELSEGLLSPVNWEVAERNFSSSTSDLNSLSGFQQETTCRAGFQQETTCRGHDCCGSEAKRRCSAVSLQSSSANLNCSSCQSKSLFRRRLSFRGLNPFHRRASEPKPDRDQFTATGAVSAGALNIPSSGNTGTMMKQKHSGDIRMTRIEMTVEILREDLCTFLVMDNGPNVTHQSQSSRWENCRLTLAKSPVGHLLQIFAPAKSPKAKKSIFCAAIKEARDATESNALGHDCVFIIQLIDGSGYMFRMETSEEKRAWVYEMQRSGVAEAKMPGSVFSSAGSSSVRPRLSTFPPSESRRMTPEINNSIPVSSVSGVPPAPCVTERVATVSRKNSLVMSPSRTGTPTIDTPPPLPSVTSVTQSQSNNPMTHSQSNEGNNLTESLASFPWYHRAITRGEAAALVVGASSIASLDAAHGRFLIRASETRPGEFVVTFNAYGKPKHLRICVEPNGQCRVQSLWFESVQAMTDHYRRYPLPLESGHSSDVKLTECIPATAKSGRARSGSVSSAAGDPPCRSPSLTQFSSNDSRFRTTQCPCIDEESKRAM